MLDEERAAAKEKILLMLQDNLSNATIAREIGIHQSTITRWSIQDKEFRKAYKKLKRKAKQFLVEKAESNLNDALDSADEKTKLTASIFVLKTLGCYTTQQHISVEGKIKTKTKPTAVLTIKREVK